jgi:hypothetical protein
LTATSGGTVTVRLRGPSRLSCDVDVYRVPAAALARLASRSRGRRSALLFERTRHDGQVLVAEPVIDDLLPFVSQAAKDGEAVVALGL